MRAFEFVYAHRLNAEHVGVWRWITTPVLFLATVEVIRLLAPCADGAGIPQTIFAAKHLNDSNFKNLGPLVSLKTMFVKIAAIFIS